MVFEEIGLVVRTALERRRRYNQVRRELDSASERELAEIGLSRYDIEDIARRSAEEIHIERAPRSVPRLVTAA